MTARSSNVKAAITGQRVFLRHPGLSDGREFVDLMRRSAHTLRPWVYAPSDLEGFRRYQARMHSERHMGFLVCLRESGRIIGVINLNEIVRGGFQSAYLGFFLGSEYAGQGYMSEALPLVMRHAFARLRLHRLEANIQPRNVRSIALVKRCGFRLEGLSPRYLKIGSGWRDHQRWAICAEDWRALRLNRREGTNGSPSPRPPAPDRSGARPARRRRSRA